MIELSQVCKRFDTLQVLSDVNLEIGPAQVVSIVGPSGAGKTTLLQIMGSLEKPDSGKVMVNGTDIASLHGNKLAHWRNTSVGFVFQFHRLLPEFTLQENVAMPAMIGGMSHTRAMDEAMKLLQYMGLVERAHHRPSQLSGGERQRGAVARALINHPSIILADEPSGSLDTYNRQELHRLFFDLRRDFGQTFVIVTHDESLATMADRTVHMTDGRITDITSTTAPTPT